LSVEKLKATCHSTQLSSALQVVSRAISGRSTLPILNNVLLETTDEGLALTATNLEIGIRKVIPAEVVAEGSTTAPARLLTDFTAALSEEMVELELDGATQSLAVRCPRFDTNVKCIDAEEFPPSPGPNGGTRFQIALDDLLRGIEQTQMAASTDEGRPILTGELFQVKGSEASLVATDGYRLAERRLTLSAGPDEFDDRLIIPARALAELPRVFRGEQEGVEVVLSAGRNQIFFRAGASEVTSRLIDGEYPNYSQVIPNKSSTVAQLPTAELAQTVRAVGLFARDLANVIRLRVTPESLVLSAMTNEVGDSRAELSATVEGPEIQIAYNARYLLDALTVLDNELVELRFDGQLSPGVVRAPGSDSYQYIIMPVRVTM
jgi:DNA polymerase III subunit beta